jgi:hypothetical protein
LDLYRGFGLGLAVCSLILALFTFFTLGLHPLLALWVGFFVVGLSILLTPTGAHGGFRGLAGVVEASVENIGRLVESLGVRSSSLYVVRGGSIYVYVYGDGVNPRDVLGLGVDRVIGFIRGSPVVVLRSPLDFPDVTGGICHAVEEVVVDRLELSESITCTESNRSAFVEFKGVRSKAGFSLVGSVGSVYAMAVATIASRLWGAPVRVSSEVWSGDRVVVGVEVVGFGEESSS